MATEAAQLMETRHQVRRFLHAHGVELQDADDIVLCVHEACANAVEHGHGASVIDVALQIEGASVSAVVTDGGCGLSVDFHRYLDKPELQQLRGRGLYLMASLMDELDVHRNGGTEIRMTKRLTYSLLTWERPRLRRALS